MVPNGEGDGDQRGGSEEASRSTREDASGGIKTSCNSAPIGVGIAAKRTTDVMISSRVVLGHAWKGHSDFICLALYFPVGLSHEFTLRMILALDRGVFAHHWHLRNLHHAHRVVVDE
jgi:hypothetical protein